MAEIIKGAEVKANLIEQMKKKMEETGVTPQLAIVRVGANDSDLAYERGVKKTCESIGISLNVVELPEDISQADFEARFKEVNDDPANHGILLFRPLPPTLDDKPVIAMIDPDKDMDCMCPYNWAKLAMGDNSGYFPCTAEAVMQILQFANVKISGAKAVVIGRSQVIGKPVGLMLLSKSATLTWCHSRTRDLAEACKDAEILVSACGVAGIVDKKIAEGVADGCVAIDVGMNFVDGKMCGDMAFDEVEPYMGKITPVPGGVGAVTNTIMCSHVVRAAVKAKTGEVFNF
ncbi:MAG: bifunctional 5,10-methylenetetrahydrofolate dehydrogenase/5,10-methenyltetrahydrofolate cyclohydrolase [Lachnospiraceae bacterium]|nr:bifunctional 5,10-methylenetetrahydrofolate dehydrogenase/5,10-methenyltetrahydrofolate cyclohydrolase [Lachnospiraceae bacterium]